VRADSTNVIVEESESNNVLATGALTIAANCSGPITIGAIKSGTLAATDCLSAFDGPGFYADVYTFSGVVGQQIAIAAQSAEIDTYVRLLNANGTVITLNDDAASDSTDSRIPVSGFITLAATGTYRVEITAFDINTIGAYTVRITERSGSDAAFKAPAKLIPGMGGPGLKVKPHGDVGR
jgi:hypothetical protein